MISLRNKFQILIFTLWAIRNCKTDTAAKAINFTYYISGGTIDDIYNLGKYVVSIQLNHRTREDEHFGRYHFCGGSIIGKTKILTAAHCLQKPSGKLFTPREVVVVVGLRNRFTRTNTTHVKEVAYIGRHRDFGIGNTLYADVGYLLLKEEILFDNLAIGIIELPDSPTMRSQRCTVIGWGKLFDKGPTSDELAFVDVRVLSRNDCERKYKNSFTAGMMCAADPDNWKRDACSGDSGGPLICKRKLVGIVSWGVGCGSKNLPGVYTDVYYYRHWILGNGKRISANRAIVMMLLIKCMVSSLEVSQRLMI